MKHSFTSFKLTLIKKVFLPFFLISISLFSLNAQLANGANKFLGNIVASSVPTTFSTYWNQVTPENSGKWGSVEGTRDVLKLTQFKTAYDFAKSNGYKFKSHTLVWGSQYPGWITGLPIADQKTEIIQWFDSLSRRFPNIDFIDVVNEPIKTACPFKEALGGDGTTGWDWVIESFRLARLYFPNSKLLINEYGTENDPPVRAKYITIINLLKSRGLIDGVGIQGHYFNLNYMTGPQLQSTLNEYAAVGLDVYISELDITGIGSVANEANQLAKYQELFPVIWNHTAVKGVTLWGYVEGATWRAGTGIINSDGTERQAMVWLKGYLKGTTASDTLNISPNTFAIDSFASRYTVNVTANINWAVSSSQSWITLSAATGTKNGSFAVIVSANTTNASRSGTVTVTGGAITRTITVTQKGSNVVVSNYVITSSAGAGGTISPVGTTNITSGASRTFTITPNSGYTIADVLVNGVSKGAVSSYAFTNVTANQTISASFKVVTATKYTLTTTVSPTGSGTIKRSPDSTSYAAGTVVTLTATPTSGYNFTSWVGANGTSAITTVTINSNTTVTATFTAINGSTANIIGADCGSNNTTLTFELNAAKRTNVTSYSWWYTGSASSTKAVTGVPYQATVVTGANFSSGQICVGTNLSAAPWYTSYCKTIAKCAATAVSQAIVSPTPSVNDFTLLALEDISAYTVNNYTETPVLKGGNISKGSSVKFGGSLPNGVYVIKIQYKSGRIESKIIPKIK